MGVYKLVLLYERRVMHYQEIELVLNVVGAHIRKL